MQGLQKLTFTLDHTQRLEQGYERVLQDSHLWYSAQLDQTESDFRGVSGIYFWVLAHDDKLHRIYVGKTKSLGYRISNYADHFQPHSPNDFKLQIFHSFIKNVLPGSELDLYFHQCAEADLKSAESEEIKFFSPLLNGRMLATPEARDALQAAFVQYYQSGFKAALS